MVRFCTFAGAMTGRFSVAGFAGNISRSGRGAPEPRNLQFTATLSEQTPVPAQI